MSFDKYSEQKTPQQAPMRREAPVTPEPPQRIAELLNGRRRPQFDQNAGFHGGPSARRKGRQMVAWSWLASVIDTLILVSLSCVFLITFSLIANISLGKIMTVARVNHSQPALFLEVLLLLGWIYLVTVRSILGFTLGEWACDLRLGQPHERLRSGYVFRVALRSSLIILTGIFTFPLLSLLLGKDIAGSVSGLRLFSLK